VIGGVGARIVYGTADGNALKWFPDRRGLVAGLTAAGFGAGAALTVIHDLRLDSGRDPHHRCVASFVVPLGSIITAATGARDATRTGRNRKHARRIRLRCTNKRGSCLI